LSILGWGIARRREAGELPSTTPQAEHSPIGQRTKRRRSLVRKVATGRAMPLRVAPGNGRYRRISSAAARADEGLLTEPRAVAHPWRRERVLMPRSGHPIFEPERPSLLRQPRLAQAIDQPVGVRRVAERYAGDMGCGRVSGVDVFQLAPHRGRVAPPAFSDRTRARRVWRLKSREFGRIPFNRLKVFNGF